MALWCCGTVWNAVNNESRGQEAKQSAIEQGYLDAGKGQEDEEKTSKMRENEPKTLKNEGKPDFPSLVTKNMYELIKMNRKVKYSQMEENLGVDESTVWRAVAWLKDNGYINKEHSKYMSN